MSQSKTIDDLYENIEKWKEIKDYLNREILAVEQSSANVSMWMEENTGRIQSLYFDIQESLREKDLPALEKAADSSADLLCLLVKMPTFRGDLLTDAVSDIFGEDVDILQRLLSVPDGFPSELLVNEENIKPDGLDDKTLLDAKPSKEVSKEPENDKNNDTNLDYSDKWLEKMQGWWNSSFNTEKAETQELEKQLQNVKNEIIGLQTEKPFYIDSFFDWVDAVQNSRPDIPGDGNYSDFLGQTYRNPEYLLSQVYNDSNEGLQAIFDEVYNKAGIYSGLKSAFKNLDIDSISYSLKRHDLDEEVVASLLEEQQQESLATWVLNVFPEGTQRTEALNVVLDAAPSEMMRGKTDKEADVFDQAVEAIVAGELKPDALSYVAKALGSDKIKDHINSKGKLTEYAKDGLIDKNLAKSLLHSVLELIDNDTKALDFYVDMHHALANKEVKAVTSLLKEADTNTLEQWLILRDIFDDNTENSYKSVIDQILDISSNSNSRSALFKVAAAVGIPPVSPEILEDKDKLQASLFDSFGHTLKSGTKTDLSVFKSILNFVQANTEKSEFKNILVNDQYSLFRSVFNEIDKESQCQEYLDILLSSLETDIEKADVLYENHLKDMPKIGEVPANDILLKKANDIVGSLVEIENDEVSTVIYPERLLELYPSYGAAGYFMGDRSEQSEADISEDNMIVFTKILGERPHAINIDGKMVNPAEWDVVLYNEEEEELDFIKNNKERVVLPLPSNDADNVLEKIANICDESISINNAVLVNTQGFETVLYNEINNELSINKTTVLPNISTQGFLEAKQKIEQKNKNTIYLQEEKLIINANSVDAVHKRSLFYDHEEKNGRKWEQFVAEILVNGRNVYAKDLFVEPEYSLDTDLDSLQKKEDASVFSLLDKFANRNEFINLSEELSINGSNVILAEAKYNENLSIFTGANEYSLDFSSENTKGQMSNKFKATASGKNNNSKESKKDIKWLSVDNLMNTAFVDIDNGNYNFRAGKKSISLKPSDLDKKILNNKYTKVLEDFLCNVDDICEVSVYKNDPKIVIKAKNENMAIEADQDNIDYMLGKLGLKDTVLGSKFGSASKKTSDEYNKSNGHMLSFFKGNDNFKSDKERFKRIKIINSGK